MEEERQKSIMMIVFFLILIITTSVFIKGYNLTIKNKNIKDTNPIVDNINTNNTNNTTSTSNISNEENETSNEESYVPEKTRYYYSYDNKYYLVLTSTYRVYANPSMGNTDNRFLINIDNYYSTDSFTGIYTIKDDKLILTVESGCLDENNEFTCVLPDDVNIDKNVITLNYTDEEILFGNIKLQKQN